MKAVLFDLDDTLYARIDPFKSAWEKLFGDGGELSCLNLAVEPERYEPLYADFVRYGLDLYEDSMQGKCTLEDMFVDRIQKTAKTVGGELTKEQALAFQRLYEWQQLHLTLSPALREALRCLREKGYFMAIVSNGASAHQRGKYEALGLPAYIPPEYFLPTGDIGVSKPDPKALLFAQEKWNLEPEDTWYVGDSLLHDIRTAASLHWHTIWLNRHPGRELTEEERKVHPEHTALSEDELTEIFKAL